MSLKTTSNPRHRKQYNTFLNCKRTIELPSNLLGKIVSKKKYFEQQHESDIKPIESNMNTYNAYRYDDSMSLQLLQEKQKYFEFNDEELEQNPNIKTTNDSECEVVPLKDYKFHTIDQFSMKNQKMKNKASKKFSRKTVYGEDTLNIEDQKRIIFEDRDTDKADKISLYQRLSGLRGYSEELKTMSFSKMLSQMVIMNEDAEGYSYPVKIPYETNNRMKKNVYYKPIEQKKYELRCQTVQNKLNLKADHQQSRKISRNLFKRFFVPSTSTSKANETNKQIAYQKTDPSGKYVFKQKKVQCRRIHNFYTTQKFKNSYDRYMMKNEKSSRSFKIF